MALPAGTRLGPYEILAPLGAGGMGEVYCAKDTRLDRTVAIKILSSRLSNNSDLKQRFEREARAISRLSHPHICALHDVGSQDGTEFLVMEFLEGETLAERLSKGALPTDVMLRYAIQIADALDKAHRQGIIHRDLKPGNIMITKSGVKLLDFGLAKLQTAASSPNLNNASIVATEARDITAQGTILGTVQYMAPEQLEGNEADARTDIFAFGSVLYEMATGKKAFSGSSQASLISAILKDEPPPISKVQPLTPSTLDRVVKTCLAKDADERWQNAHDLMKELIWITEGGSQASSTASVLSQHKRSDHVLWFTAGLAIAAIAAAILLWMLAERNSAPLSTKSIKRMTVVLPENEPLALAKFGPLGIGRTAIALSPDGSLLAYAAEHNGASQLFLRALDQFNAKPMLGTEGAYGPFFSPDGRWLGFFSENKLKKISVQGGEPVTLCEARNPHGASWGPDDTIVFADSEGMNLLRVSAAGGSKEVLPNKLHQRTFYPEFLPDGKSLLCSIKTPYNPNYGEIAVLSLATGERRVVLKGGVSPRFVASGHIVFARAGSILAAPFDLTRLEVTGPPVTLIEGIRIEEWGAAQFALSKEGTLVYVSGGPAWIGRLTMADHNGISKPLAASAQAYGPLSLSPDGQRLAVTVSEATSDVWIYDLTRGTFTRLTVEGSNYRPIWTLEGKRIAYYRLNGPNESQVILQAADGSDDGEVLVTSKNPLMPGSFSPDGKFLMLHENIEQGFDLSLLRLDRDRRLSSWLKTRFSEWAPAFSPDGKWIAYVSDESGQYEIYVRSFQDSAGKRQISNSGGEEPTWSPDGHTLYYRNGQTWMSVAVETQPEFRAEAPKVMFEGAFLNVPGISYAPMPDGQHFILIEENQKQPPTTQLNVVLNWLEDLKQ